MHQGKRRRQDEPVAEVKGKSCQRPRRQAGTSPRGFTDRLLQLKGSAAYNLTVD
jgi:hypothetical protein